MELFAPCFISGFSAAEYWDLTEQLFTTIVVFTTKRQGNNEQQIAHTRFLTRLIPAREMFGTQKIWRGNVAILVADRHRTIIDAVDRPDLAGGGRHMADMLRAYWKSGDTDPDRLLDYALTLGRGVLFKRLGFSAELFGNVSAAWLSACRQHISCGISKLDPAGPDTGPILTRWRLRANVRVEETT
jgi:predicted transcriptional regulator of viral defense system